MRLTFSMGLRICLVSAISLCTVLISALPSTPPRSSGNVDGLTLVVPNNTTIRGPLPFPVGCFDNSQPLVPSDCTFVINQMLLNGRGAYIKRPFIHQWYKKEDGQYAPSRWTHSACQISVQGYGELGQMLSFADIAFTANHIVSECVEGVIDPDGGLSIIGDGDLEFAVIVSKHGAPWSVSAEESRVSPGSAGAAAERARRSPSSSKHAEEPRGIGTRDVARKASRISLAHVVASNSTFKLSAPPEYPIHCFSPSIIVIPPAVATDCIHIINNVILRLADPTRRLSFGFTDAVDINLLEPEYQKWQDGQCVISVSNNDVTQMDHFRLIDVAIAARRLVSQCVIATREKMGGVVSIGTEERGFYVYVGSPLEGSKTSAKLGESSVDFWR